MSAQNKAEQRKMKIKEFLECKTEDTRNIALLIDYYMGKAINTAARTLDMDVVSRMYIELPNMACVCRIS